MDNEEIKKLKAQNRQLKRRLEKLNKMYEGAINLAMKYDAQSQTYLRLLTHAEENLRECGFTNDSALMRRISNFTKGGQK